METVRKVAVVVVLAVLCVGISGCGKGADENKPIAEVTTEAAKMSAKDLRAMAMKYKNAIVAKQGDVEKLQAKLKQIPLADMVGEQAKALKADIDNLSKSISALKERFNVYYNQLKEKGGDLSGLDI